MLNVIICDDEKDQVKGLEKLVHKVCPLDCRVTAVEDEEALMCELAQKQYDICILDIRLKQENGIDLAEAAMRRDPNLIVIFISGYTEYYEEVYRVNHIYFILKPVSEEKLKSSIEKAIEIIRSREGRGMLMRTNLGMINIYIWIVCIMWKVRGITFCST